MQVQVIGVSQSLQELYGISSFLQAGCLTPHHGLRVALGEGRGCSDFQLFCVPFLRLF